MTSEKCSQCEGELKLWGTAQQLVSYVHDKYWTEVNVYECINCKTLHIVDSP